MVFWLLVVPVDVILFHQPASLLRILFFPIALLVAINLYGHYYLVTTVDPGNPKDIIHEWRRYRQRIRERGDDYTDWASTKHQEVNGDETLHMLPPSSERRNPDADDTRMRQCRKCRALGITRAAKPARAHHCRVCKRCVLMMDHHCPWVNQCVSGEKSF